VFACRTAFLILTRWKACLERGQRLRRRCVWLCYICMNSQILSRQLVSWLSFWDRGQDEACRYSNRLERLKTKSENQFQKYFISTRRADARGTRISATRIIYHVFHHVAAIRDQSHHATSRESASRVSLESTFDRHQPHVRVRRSTHFMAHFSGGIIHNENNIPSSSMLMTPPPISTYPNLPVSLEELDVASKTRRPLGAKESSDCRRYVEWLTPNYPLTRWFSVLTQGVPGHWDVL